MPRLVPVFSDVDGKKLFQGEFDAVDERTGATIATGFLRAELVVVGQRIVTDVKFVANTEETA